MKTPIIIFESADVGVYPSVKKVYADIEIQDVKDGIYEAYDADGYRLDLVIEQEMVDKSFFCIHWKESREQIMLKKCESEQTYVDEIRTKLIQYLRCMKFSGKDVENSPLYELIDTAEKYMPW